ncbi:unnamed protein product [Chondrus crispus]|uniref:Uncharacterized protein n=1 Tax=Chondrus crispus TaxID=2769 RepID=R7QR24_CHOCR|nr:unnamed protein product [Chondrus crispus]CDF39926.1 unnamed protein product [Chondrus crispus]|eukprot:XP_005710220.1 unnamed protein product [Chondrus crispus]
MSELQGAFLHCPLSFHLTSRLLFSSSRKKACQTWTVKGQGTNSTPQRSSKGPQTNDDKNSGKSKVRRLHGNSLQRLARKVGEARDKFMEASDEAKALKSSPDGFILGSEFSNLGISSMSLKQDLDVPPAPKYWGLDPQHVFEKVREYLVREGVDESDCDEYIEDLGRILSALRGWTFAISDQARPLLQLSDHEGNDDVFQTTSSDSVDALVTLLQLGGFAVLPDIIEITDPPCPEALPLGESIKDTLDPTLSQHSPAVRQHIESNGVNIGSSSHYPYLFIATRGVTLVRNSGLLFPQKIRAIERSYFSWISAPFAFFVKPILALNALGWNLALRVTQKELDRPDGREDAVRVLSAGPDVVGQSGSPNDSSLERTNTKRVRRVVPALKLDGGWNSLARLFLPTFTQEPAHELLFLMYREVDLDKDSIRREARRKLAQQVKESVAEVINPIPRKRRTVDKPKCETGEAAFYKFQKPIGRLKPVSINLFRSVQWGTIKHFLPSTFVLPATRDLLRIDALTLLGLVSTIATYARNAETPFVFPLLFGSLATYAVRVIFGWRSSLSKYKGQIASERAKAILSQERSALDSLAVIAAEEQLPDVCSVWLCGVLKNMKEASEIQEDVFGEVTLCRETVQSWKDWLNDMAAITS